jgi:hypothetical protein
VTLHLTGREARSVSGFFCDGCYAALAGKEPDANPYRADDPYAAGCWDAGYVFMGRRLVFWIDTLVDWTLEDAA